MARIITERCKPYRPGIADNWVAHYKGYEKSSMWGYGNTREAAETQLRDIWPNPNHGDALAVKILAIAGVSALIIVPLIFILMQGQNPWLP